MTNDASTNRIGAAVAWSLLVLLLVTNVPLFLCMPLTDDAAMYDLQALNWLRGGMLYRDILEPNLPGVIWLHAVVRGTLGTSSMALRAVDLVLFSIFVALSRNWLNSIGRHARNPSLVGPRPVRLLFLAQRMVPLPARHLAVGPRPGRLDAPPPADPTLAIWAGPIDTSPKRQF